MTGTPSFRFVQFELPYDPGVTPGRYVMRDHLGAMPSHVVVVSTVGTLARSPRRRHRGAKPTASNPPTPPLTLWRVTVIDACPLTDTSSPDDALSATDRGAAIADAEARGDRILHAAAIARGGPTVSPRLRHGAVAVRCGVGRGDLVAEGQWDFAVTVALPAEATGLLTDARLAALVGGRDVTLAAEAFALRARADLHARRSREAAVGTAAAVRLAVRELVPWCGHADLATRVTELADLEPEATAISDGAHDAGLSDDAVRRVDVLLGRVEAALRARTHAAL